MLKDTTGGINVGANHELLLLFPSDFQPNEDEAGKGFCLTVSLSLVKLFLGNIWLKKNRFIYRKLPATGFFICPANYAGMGSSAGFCSLRFLAQVPEEA